MKRGIKDGEVTTYFLAFAIKSYVWQRLANLKNHPKVLRFLVDPYGLKSKKETYKTVEIRQSIITVCLSSV